MSSSRIVTPPEELFEKVHQSIISILESFISRSNIRGGVITSPNVMHLLGQAKAAITPFLVSRPCQEWIEANCADHLHAIITKRGPPSVSMQLSATQQSYVGRTLTGYVSAQLRDKEKRACCLLAAALYDPSRHHITEVLQNLEALLKRSVTRSGVFEIDKQSEEYKRRRVDYFLASESLDDQPEYHEEREPETTIDSDYSERREKFLHQISSALSELKSSRLNLQEQSVDAAFTQLCGVVHALDPIRVAVVGCVSDGKSTFISHLLGCPNFLRSNNGSTTAVAAELVHAPVRHYRASIIFVSDAEHEADIKYYNSIRRNPEAMNEYDEKFAVILGRLSSFYAYRFEGNDMIIDFSNANGDLVQNIGREPLVLEADTMESLSKLLKKEPLLCGSNPTIASIRVEGPFRHIPPGVILVDTPGLGDSDDSKSLHTLELLHKVHVIWFVNPLDKQLAREWDRRSLLKVKQLGKLVREWHVIISKADMLEERTDDVITTYKNNISKVFGEETANMGVQFFSHKYSDQDCGPWRDTLHQYGREQYERFTGQIALVKDLTKKFEEEGWGNQQSRLRTSEIRFQNSLNEFRASIRTLYNSRVHETGVLELISVVISQWNTYKARSRTISAIMHPARAGEFIGQRSRNKSDQIRVHYDLNGDIAAQWLSRIQPLWEKFLADVECIQASICTIGQGGSLASNLHDQIFRLGRTVFELDCKELIRDHLKQFFSETRTTFPTENELLKMFQDLFHSNIEPILANGSTKNSFQQIMNITACNVSARSAPHNERFSQIMKTLRDEIGGITQASSTAVASSSSSRRRRSSSCANAKLSRDREESDTDLPHPGKKVCREGKPQNKK